ncbi:hypothetical protein GCM10022212_10670 [Actimicrobium antarcticum]|uniref:Uncharacterized protein n=1 Tax=Actimicrobium antarcticum TaxID=1051899 RepID=A0ABP7SVJ0_9BURK
MKGRNDERPVGLNIECPLSVTTSENNNCLKVQLDYPPSCIATKNTVGFNKLLLSVVFGGLRIGGCM